MKTAVSIPDPIFEAAESLAKRMGITRSRLFARALESYIEAHRDHRIREALDRVYTAEASSIDEVLAQMQWASLQKEDW